MKEANNVFVGKLRFNRSAVLASLAAAAMSVGSPQALAQMVCSTASIAIPATLDGIYINFVTGEMGSTGAVSGWDFNVFADSGVLKFFSSSSTFNETRYVGTGTTVQVLAAGTLIDATSLLSTAGVAPGGAFQEGVTDGYVGVVFNNEGTATTNYGWASLTTTGPNGFPATINAYCYQNDGTGIIAGADGIFANGFDNLM